MTALTQALTDALGAAQALDSDLAAERVQRSALASQVATLTTQVAALVAEVAMLRATWTPPAPAPAPEPAPAPTPAPVPAPPVPPGLRYRAQQRQLFQRRMGKQVCFIADQHRMLLLAGVEANDSVSDLPHQVAAKVRRLQVQRQRDLTQQVQRRAGGEVDIKHLISLYTQNKN